MPGVLRLVLEVPLAEKERRARDLPLGVSRLLLARRHPAIEASEVLPVYAEVLFSCVRPSDRVYIWPINLFSAPDAWGTPIRCTEPERGLLIEDPAVWCPSPEVLIRAFDKVECEEMAMFFAPDDARAIRTIAAVAQYRGPQGSHNAAFLGAGTDQDGFLFYAPSHVSVEILGREAFVVDRCFAAALRVFRRSCGG